MFQRNGKKISIDRDLTIGEGVEAITYPAASLQNAATRAALGIVDVPDPVRPDDTRYWVVENADGSYTATPKETALADEIAALIKQIEADADGLYTAALGNRATEYAEAESQAQGFKDAGYAGVAPAYVQAWADATGNTAQWAADSILATATAWRSAQTAIRTNRLAHKEAARRATDFDALDLVKAGWTAAVQSIRAQLGAT